MGLATITDVQLNFVGTVLGLTGVIITTQFQIWQGKNQHDYKLNAMQINSAQSLPTFITCSLLALCVEFSGFFRGSYILSHHWTAEELKLIVLSALLAAFANLTCYGLIGSTSAITYQVTGHVKTALILITGYFLTKDDREMNRTNVIGILICLLGSLTYGFIRHAEQASASFKENLSAFLSIMKLWTSITRKKRWRVQTASAWILVRIFCVDWTTFIQSNVQYRLAVFEWMRISNK